MRGCAWLERAEENSERGPWHAADLGTACNLASFALLTGKLLNLQKGTPL